MPNLERKHDSLPAINGGLDVPNADIAILESSSNDAQGPLARADAIVGPLERVELGGGMNGREGEQRRGGGVDVSGGVVRRGGGKGGVQVDGRMGGGRGGVAARGGEGIVGCARE